MEVGAKHSTDRKHSESFRTNFANLQKFETTSFEISISRRESKKRRILVQSVRYQYQGSLQYIGNTNIDFGHPILITIPLEAVLGGGGISCDTYQHE